MPTRVTLGSIPRKTRANCRRQPEQDHLTSALADHQLRRFPNHEARSHYLAPTRIGSARAGLKMKSSPADTELQRFPDHGGEMRLLAMGCRPELDLGQFQGKPEPTIGGNPSTSVVPEPRREVSLSGTDQNWKCPSRTQYEICPCRHRTPKVPGPRRRNEAPCHGMPTRVTLGSIPRKTRANCRRQPEQDHLTSALADHQLRRFPNHEARSHYLAPTRIGSARAGLKMKSSPADTELQRFPDHGGEMRLLAMGCRPELDLGQFQGKPEPTIGGNPSSTT
ncbi:hypothetical protein TIFTF001_056449 [Ficus carica]|uniref:Uncharacterized protein n=1 Tax=Ficus carica TaxID=3494 RepID=A0AA88JI34_FICCA|nr:hypothetical protein TIFTF001_056449 [Ficus carica]